VGYGFVCSCIIAGCGLDVVGARGTNVAFGEFGIEFGLCWRGHIGLCAVELRFFGCETHAMWDVHAEECREDICYNAVDDVECHERVEGAEGSVAQPVRWNGEDAI